MCFDDECPEWLANLAADIAGVLRLHDGYAVAREQALVWREDCRRWEAEQNERHAQRDEILRREALPYAVDWNHFKRIKPSADTAFELDSMRGYVQVVQPGGKSPLREKGAHEWIRRFVERPYIRRLVPPERAVAALLGEEAYEKVYRVQVLEDARCFGFDASEYQSPADLSEDEFRAIHRKLALEDARRRGIDVLRNPQRHRVSEVDVFIDIPFGAWVPAELASARDAKYELLPVPKRPLSLAEKYVALSIIQDRCGKGERVNPWGDRDRVEVDSSSSDAFLYYMIWRFATNLTPDADEKYLRHFLDDVKQDLEARHGTSGGSDGQEVGRKVPLGYLGGTELAEALGIELSRRDAFFKGLERKRRDFGDNCWIEISDPKSNAPQYLYRADSQKIRDFAKAYTKPRPA